jgi:DNA polymerase-3 subunit delta'
MLFREIIGQQDMISRLVRTVKEDRVSHAQLFLGSDGAGAFPLAMAYAQYLNCENRQETDSCGACPSCQQFKTNQHPDLHFSFPFFNREKESTSGLFASEWRSLLKKTPYFGLEDWRNHLDAGTKQLFISVYESNSLMKKVSLKSFGGGYKVVIIWHPEFMKAPAANKMLKVIEEPPEKTIFLLVTDSTEQMLATILSRTQILKIPNLNDEDVRSALITKKGVVSGDVIDQVVQYSHGDYCKALRKLGQTGVDSMLENFRNWMRICYKKDVTEIRRWADKMHDTGREDVKQFIEYSLHMVRQCLMENYTHGQLSRLSGEEKSFTDNFASFINDRNIVEITNELDLAHRDVTRNVYMKLVMFDLSLKLHGHLRA